MELGVSGGVLGFGVCVVVGGGGGGLGLRLGVAVLEKDSSGVTENSMVSCESATSSLLRPNTAQRTNSLLGRPMHGGLHTHPNPTNHAQGAARLM